MGKHVTTRYTCDMCGVEMVDDDYGWCSWRRSPVQNEWQADRWEGTVVLCREHTEAVSKFIGVDWYALSPPRAFAVAD